MHSLLLLAPRHSPTFSCFFFFNDTAPTEIYTLSLHDALPISTGAKLFIAYNCLDCHGADGSGAMGPDRKSTRLNSSHRCISYAVFCLKKKKKHEMDGNEMINRIRKAGQSHTYVPHS